MIYNAVGGSVAWALRCAYRHTEMVIRKGMAEMNQD